MTYTARRNSVPLMENQSERLALAIKESGLSKREMADRWGWSYNTLKSNSNGNMPFAYKRAMMYASRLKVRAEWLYSGEGEMRERPAAHRRPAIEVPVIGWVQAGALSDVSAIQELAELERVVIDGLPPGEWFATDVHGDSMDRVAPDGSRLFVNIKEKDPKAGGYYLFSNRGETTFKRYYDDPVPRLEPFSWNPANRPIYLGKQETWEVIGRVHRSMIDLK